MVPVTESCNRRRFSRVRHYAWPVLLSLPAISMAIFLGGSLGMNGFVAGVYTGIALTIISLVGVRWWFSRGE